MIKLLQLFSLLLTLEMVSSQNDHCGKLWAGGCKNLQSYRITRDSLSGGTLIQSAGLCRELCKAQANCAVFVIVNSTKDCSFLSEKAVVGCAWTNDGDVDVYSVNECTRSEDWGAPVRFEVAYYYDPSFPLQVLTTSELGSEDQAGIHFRDKNKEFAGAFYLGFDYTTILYNIGYCMAAYKRFPVDLPRNSTLVWTISRTTDGFRVSCNDIEVLDLALSDEVCDRVPDDNYIGWKQSYAREIASVTFKRTRDAAKAFQTSSKYVLRKPEKNTCGYKMSRITEARTCEKAASQLGFNYQNSIKQYFNLPSGCITANKVVLFNSHNVRRASKEYSLLCELTGPRCSEPSVDHGTVEPRRTSGESETYSLTCNEGFTSSGLDTITCTLNKQRTVAKLSDTLVCSQVLCTGLPKSWSKITTNAVFPLRGSLTISCVEDLELLGSEVITCVKDTEFSFSEEPRCIKVLCTGLPKSWSKITTNAVFPLRGSLTISCVEDLELLGSEVITCVKDTEFSFSEEPRCIKVLCTGLPKSWSKITTNAVFPLRGSLTISCVEDLELLGSEVITCVKDTEFSFSEEPRCFNDGNWIKLISLVKVKQDFKRKLLEIKGKVTAVENEDSWSKVMFTCNNGSSVNMAQGGIGLRMTPSKFTYIIYNCNEESSVPNPVSHLEDQDDIVWSINYISTARRIRVQCNGVEVLNFVVSNNKAICSYADRPTFVNTWLRSWKDNARVIEFHSVDSAKYRFEPLVLCTGLPETWNNVQTKTVFPLGQENLVKIGCSEELVLHGDEVITCVKDTQYTFSQKPWCVTGFDPDLDYDKTNDRKDQKHNKKIHEQPKPNDMEYFNFAKYLKLTTVDIFRGLKQPYRSTNSSKGNMEYFDMKRYLELTTVDVFAHLRSTEPVSKDTITPTPVKLQAFEERVNRKENNGILIEIVESGNISNFETGVMNSTLLN